jgi:membrane-associated phospholipid phosphatase
MTAVSDSSADPRSATRATPVVRPMSAYASGLGLALLACVALAIDLPVARFVAEWDGHEPLDSLREIVSQFEPFAHAAGVAGILLVIFVLDRSRRRSVLRLAACAFGAGLLTDLIKLSVARVRPVRALELQCSDVWATFEACFACLNNWSLAIDRTIQSFPSGHAATAAGLAVGLCWLYPRGRWLFALFAVLASLQRILALAHFPSDVFAGAAIGCLIGAACTDGYTLGRFFDRFELRRAAGNAAS